MKSDGGLIDLTLTDIAMSIEMAEAISDSEVSERGGSVGSDPERGRSTSEAQKRLWYGAALDCLMLATNLPPVEKS